MKAIVLGGTTGMGRAIAQRLSQRGDSVFLMGLDETDLARSVADLRARAATVKDVQLGFAVCDLEKPEGFADALDSADSILDNFDTVIVTAAMFASQDALEADIELRKHAGVLRARA
jgi:decaprenylphospho-beta-D-erythro-pentofuranosid-2-ulose 2-reductase